MIVTAGICFKKKSINYTGLFLSFSLLLCLLFGFAIETSHAHIVIQSKIDQEPWRKNKAIYPLKRQKIRLKVEKVPHATIKWFQIIPDLSVMYKNANFPWDKNPYQWIGLAKIRYQKREMARHRGKWIISPSFKESPFSSEFYRDDVGSFWLQAQIETDGTVLASPGIETADHRGLSPSVFRISIRAEEGYLGYLTSFFNVPGLFGSIIYQSYNYIGVDCADVLMAAYARWKKQPIKTNYNVARLVEKLRKVHRFTMKSGTPQDPVYWKKDIRPGDFIAVKPYGGRQYYHIGAVYSDDNRNGVLDGNDIVLHAGPMPLMFSYLKDAGFNGHVVILRPS